MFVGMTPAGKSFRFVAFVGVLAFAGFDCTVEIGLKERPVISLLLGAIVLLPGEPNLTRTRRDVMRTAQFGGQCPIAPRDQIHPFGIPLTSIYSYIMMCVY